VHGGWPGPVGLFSLEGPELTVGVKQPAELTYTKRCFGSPVSLEHGRGW